MTEAPVQLAKQLAKQLAVQSKDASVLARIVALSASDDAFLATPKDSNFNAAWPSDYFNLEDAAFTEAFLGLISAARDVDPRLQKRSDRLVPKKTDEPGCAAPHRTRTRTAPAPAPRRTARVAAHATAAAHPCSRAPWAASGAATSGTCSPCSAAPSSSRPSRRPRGTSRAGPRSDNPNPNPKVRVS